MTKRKSEQVPEAMQRKFEEITKLTDSFCSQYLNSEYAELARQLTAALCASQN